MRLIYHYCPMETFNLIIKNKTLRLSDITKSNDSKEKRWIYNNLERAMTNAFQKMHLTMKPGDSDGIGTYLSTTKNDLDETVKQESLVACFSRADDLLSQWRGYANDGCGFAIGFDQDLLQKYLKKDKRFRIASIEYDEEKQIDMIESDIKRAFFECVIRMDLDLKNYTGAEGRDFDYSPHEDIFYEEYDDISSDMASYFDFSSCLIKNGAFREEDEVRIIFSSKLSLGMELGYEVETKIKGTTKLNLRKLDYQVKGAKLVPFIDMDFSKAINEGIIKKIIIGPKANVSEEELYTYLWYNGFHDVDVKESNASYV